MIASGFASPSAARRWRALAVSGCVAGAALAAGAADAASDPALLDAARRPQPAVVESLKDMVMIESGSANAEGLARMADYTERRLKELGAQTAGRARSSRRVHRARLDRAAPLPDGAHADDGGSAELTCRLHRRRRRC